MSFVSTRNCWQYGYARAFSYDCYRRRGDGRIFKHLHSSNCPLTVIISFFIRGRTGGEKLIAMMDDGTNYPQNPDWIFRNEPRDDKFQKVVISTQAFYSSPHELGFRYGRVSSFGHKRFDRRAREVILTTSALGT